MERRRDAAARFRDSLRGQNRTLLQSPRCSAILAQALGRLFLRQKVANEATPQTDEMYSGSRDRDRLKALSGSG
jgi:hypothetical protein